MGSGFRDDRITVMLVHPWDASNHDAEWRAVLHEFDFGQLIAPGGPDRVLPVVVPTHFTFDGDHTVQLHLAKPNPVWRALAERPRALLTVVTDYVYVPAAVNSDAGAGEDPAFGVPTSCYAAVQAEVDVETVEDPAAKAAILATALSHFEPAGSLRAAPALDVPTDRRQIGGIRGLRLTITGVNAKFKRRQQDRGAPRRDRRCATGPQRPYGCDRRSTHPGQGGADGLVSRGPTSRGHRDRLTSRRRFGACEGQ
jgi:transcriptional regulator